MESFDLTRPELDVVSAYVESGDSAEARAFVKGRYGDCADALYRDAELPPSQAESYERIRHERGEQAAQEYLRAALSSALSRSASARRFKDYLEWIHRNVPAQVQVAENEDEDGWTANANDYSPLKAKLPPERRVQFGDVAAVGTGLAVGGCSLMLTIPLALLALLMLALIVSFLLGNGF